MTIRKDLDETQDCWSDWLLHRRFGGNDDYRPVLQKLVEKIRDRVLDGARLAPGMTLLDVGAGDGLISFGALQRVDQPFTVIVSDISGPLLAHAERVSEELGLRKYCSFVQTSADDLAGIADNAVDVLTVRAVLAYVQDKASALKSFLRVLRPGGRISLCEPIHQDAAIQLAALTNVLGHQPENLSTPYLKLIQRYRALQLPSDLSGIRDSSITNFSERDLIQLFRAAGFVDIHMELHVDVKESSPMSWSTFIDTAPLPGTPSLREIFDEHFTVAERTLLETGMKRDVETGTLTGQTVVVYLTAEKR